MEWKRNKKTQKKKKMKFNTRMLFNFYTKNWVS